MIEEHLAEALLNPEPHPLRVVRHMPRLFRCGALTAETIDNDIIVERLLPHDATLFLEDQKWGYDDLMSNGYRNATARDILRGLRFD